MESTLNPSGGANNLVKKVETKKNYTVLLSFVSITVALAGIGTGYLLSGLGKTDVVRDVSTDLKMTDTEAGILDESAFPDTAEGILEEGGVNGEGTHHLVRGNGPSQYAYLTSTVINLDSFVGKKVEVRGQTITGKKAGWLMDVGMVKVVE